MSRIASRNCRWCGDRPGGCLYCVGQEPDNAAMADLIRGLIERNEIHVLAVRTTEEYLVRHADEVVQRGAGGPVGPPYRGNRNTLKRELQPCTEHVWRHDAKNLKRRFCVHAGCSASQVFVWRPDSALTNGEWVNEAYAGLAIMTEARKQRTKRKVKV